MELHNESEINDENIKEDDGLSISEDRRRSSSSSVSSISDIESAITDFSFDDSSQIDKHEHVDDEALETDVGDVSALESPSVQVMERPNSNSQYRIPSRVFATNKSSNPEWSTCSNESLFSIHTGNMSFTRDQFSMFLKSSELGKHGPGDIRKSGELPLPSPTNVREESKDDLPKEDHVSLPTQETRKSREDIAAQFETTPPPPLPSPDKEQVVDLIGMKKDDTISDTKDKTSSVASDESTVSKSHHSNASGQSFAFPVFTEVGREKSINSGPSHKGVDHQKNSSVVLDKETTKTSSKATTEATPASSSWFSSCCSCC